MTAWDYACCWVADEPFSHRPAAPASVLLAIMSTALLWGWLTEAAILGLTWAGILRIGEMLQACRQDLVLPQDSAPGVSYDMLKIKKPKSRGRRARHQAARVDPSDIVLLIEIAFTNKGADEKLWLLSASTLRKRLGDLLKVLKLKEAGLDEVNHFDLSSCDLEERVGCSLFVRTAKWSADVAGGPPPKLWTSICRKCCMLPMASVPISAKKAVENLCSWFPGTSPACKIFQ